MADEAQNLVAPKKHVGGRPRKVLDLSRVEDLAAQFLSDEEIAAQLGCSHDTLASRRAKSPRLQEQMARGRARGRSMLRSAQFKLALQGNPTMQIWLGKQYLGQKDYARWEHSGPDGALIPLSLFDAVAEKVADDEG